MGIRYTILLGVDLGVPQLEFNAKIDPTLPAVVPDAISFETGASRKQAGDPDLFVYEHHGVDFGPADPGALTSFFEDMILGRPLPLVFATHQVRDLDTIVAMALFFQRTLAIHPAMPGFVACVDLVHRRGPAMLGHIEPNLGRFFLLLRTVFPEKGLSKRELGERIATAIRWITEYLDGGPPALGIPWPSVRVLDVGTDGFVVAETSGHLPGGWVELYRKGHLRGLLIGPDIEGRRKVLIARKSPTVSFDLSTAAEVFNEMERAMGELPEWRLAGSPSTWLWGPERGTLLRVGQMLELLKRV